MKRKKILKALKKAHKAGLTLDDIIPVLEGFKDFAKEKRTIVLAGEKLEAGNAIYIKDGLAYKVDPADTISKSLNKKLEEVVFRPLWKEGLTLTDTINSDNVVLNISDGEYRTFHKHHVIAREIKIDIKNIKDLVYHKVNVLLYLVGDKVKYSITSLNKKVKGVIPLYSVDIITYNGSVSETAIRDLRGMKFN